MTVESSLYALLAGLGYRVFTPVIPVGAQYPALAVQIISTAPVSNLGGASSSAVYRAQVTVTGETYADARATTSSLVTDLDGLIRPDDYIQSIAWDNESAGDATDTGRPVDIRVDFLVAYSAIPAPRLGAADFTDKYNSGLILEV